MKRIFLTVLCFLLCLGLMGCGGKADTPASSPPEATAEPTETPPAPTPEAKYNSLSEGMYKVGKDIAAGEYYLEATGNFAAYLCVSSDSNSTDILVNENFDNHTFVTVEDGQYFEFNRAVAMPVDGAKLNFDPSNLAEGTYRIGIDIPAGEYVLNCTGKYQGYVCVYDNSTVSRKIQTNAKVSGQRYVSVDNGQYLQLNRCTAQTEGTETGTSSQTSATTAQASLETAEAVIYTSTKDNFDYVETERDETAKSITLSIAQDGFAKEVAALIEAGKKQDDGWDKVKNNLCEMCTALSNSVKTVTGDDEIHIFVMLLNDGNHSNALLGVLDGIVIYDVLTE